MCYKNDFPLDARRAGACLHQKKTRAATVLLLILLLLIPLLSFADRYDEVVHSVSDRNGILQRMFEQFPLLTAVTNNDGQCHFQTLSLKEPIVSVEGIGFYGFRFKVPKRAAHGDFAWAFGAPRPRYNWFILSKTETMPGFEDYFHEPRRAYNGLEHLFPASGNEVVLQRLAGDELEDEKEYLIWFTFRSPKPTRLSVAFTFADSQSEKSNRAAIEKAMGLKRKPKKSANTEGPP